MLRVAVAIAVLLACGCASGPPVVPRTDGPLGAGALGRSTFTSPHVTLLARDADDAEEAAGFAARVADDFTQRTGRPASARVLVVAGSGGWIDDAPRRLELMLRGEAALKSEEPPTPGEMQQLQAELTGEEAELGLAPALLLTLRASVLRAADFTALGLPPAAAEAFDWGFVLPTGDEIEDVVDLAVDAALEKEEVTFAMRLLVTPLLPFVRGAMTDVLVAQMQGLLFAMHASAQADWSAGDRASQVEGYVATLSDEAEARRAEPSFRQAPVSASP